MRGWRRGGFVGGMVVVMYDSDEDDDDNGSELGGEVFADTTS